MRKEQVLLILTALLLGWFVYDDLTGSATTRQSRSSNRLDYVSTPAPDVERALPTAREGRFERDLFTPPRDTEPLAPLELVAPPLEELATLAPPASRGPRPRVMGAALRRPSAVDEVPGLFVDAYGDLPDPEAGLDGGGAAAEVAEAVVRLDDMTFEERTAQRASFRRIYDAVLIDNVERFGFIRNSDRFGLQLRPDEDLSFEEFDPEKGRPRFPGQPPISYARDRIGKFDFAQTVANAIELEYRLKYHDEVAPSDFTSALEFAAKAVHARNDAPHALEIAAEIYAKTEAIAGGDVRPKLGLARCYEAGFRFEEAFDVYRALIAGAEDKNPVVHARLASLLARFRLFDRAEESFREALRWGRTDWEANWRFGRFLADRGRGAQAIEHLERARANAGGEVETIPERTELRTDLGWAYVFEGRYDDAADAFADALTLTPAHEAALAGQASLVALGAGGGSSEAPVAGADSGFEMLHARALVDLTSERWNSALAGFEAAAASDPFRAYCAYRAISWLAERTGYPEEAYSFVERAFEIDPTDPYTLFQRGRMMVSRDDLVGARESFQAAIDRELDFAEALVELAEIARRMGQHENAERYFERALRLDDSRPIVHARRGLNMLALGRVEEAEETFRTALGLDPDLSSGRLGLAWCAYASGESGESLTLFADVIESRRNAPEGDPARAYAEAQIARIQDHESKELWHERFDRAPGARIGNGWKVDQKHGLTVVIDEGGARMAGQADTRGRTRLFQELPAERFVSCEFELTIGPGRSRVGVFISRERNTRGEWQVQSEVTLSRSQDGIPGWRLVKRGEADAQHTDLVGVEWPTGRPVRVKIERRGESSDSTATMSVDGVPVLEELPVPTLGTTSATMRFGVFVEADTGRSAEVRVDNVEVIRRVQD